ncbi:MAG: hypothetical protein IPP99_12310 [Chitinophagaceae bacterium]|nr:hypothetical protein [Chitinophagaceae bacterium]
MEQDYDIITITTGHKEYRSNPALLAKMLEKQEAFIYDTTGVLTNEEIGTPSGKHKVRGVGQGRFAVVLTRLFP